MTWLAWRQLRAKAALVYGLLAAAAAVLVVAGRPVTTDVAEGVDTLYSGGILAVYGLPAVVGVFWGAPLVARELASGTFRLAWSQSVTRTRWLATKLAFTGAAAVVAAGLLSLAVTWWSWPLDAASRPATIAVAREMVQGETYAARMTPLVFGARGIVPIGYAAFAFALGVAAGILLRRTVLAMAVTLAVYAAVLFTVTFVARPHLLPPDRATVPVTAQTLARLGFDGAGEPEQLAVAGPPGSWVLGNETVDTAGRAAKVPPWALGCMPPPDLPSAGEACFDRLTALGYRQRLTYHPEGHFWAMQGIETAIFLALSALLAWLCLGILWRLRPPE
ncbi:ABC transporter permease [Nonomuraea sp. NPDC050556]|uniref:ABC transporter permease n=1 Tax=Nonomuraea sp. NPDC050556 TaxID=3364369 RepID=UPI0037895906